jgi:lipid-binding SYLF domain-containing protein
MKKIVIVPLLLLLGLLVFGQNNRGIIIMNDPQLMKIIYGNIKTAEKRPGIF